MGAHNSTVPAGELQRAALREGKLILVVLAPSGIHEYDLELGKIAVIGRAPASDVTIDHSSVSRSHARLHCREDGLVIEDLGSRNGTFLNGERLGREPQQIAPGDDLQIGSVEARLHLVHGNRRRTPRAISDDELSAALAQEMERCARFDRSLALLAIDGGTAPATELAPQLAGLLRDLDLCAIDGDGRVLILLTEASKPEALEVAGRLAAHGAARGHALRLGVAAFPDDASSPQGLRHAAALALRSVEGSGVGAARDAVRVVRIRSRQVVLADPALIRLFRLVESVASAPLPALVIGETGSGKEVVAEALHALGRRSAAPFVKINCAAVPDQLLESELFGHERGAFTGAESSKPGLIEEAEGGTLFLDEIGDMPLSLQAKLLGVLEESKVRRVGALKEKAVDVRFVAATHRDLSALIRQGTFREDLFYRLTVLVLAVPPLRDRRREIRLLAERFASEVAVDLERKSVSISAAAMEVLEGHAWPGNVRELRNAISRSVVSCPGTEIGVEHLPSEITGGRAAGAPPADAVPARGEERESDDGAGGGDRVPLAEEMREFERRRILQVLDECKGSRARAAERLGLPRRTLDYKLASMGMRARAGKDTSR